MPWPAGVHTVHISADSLSPCTGGVGDRVHSSALGRQPLPVQECIDVVHRDVSNVRNRRRFLLTARSCTAVTASEANTERRLERRIGVLISEENTLSQRFSANHLEHRPTPDTPLAIFQGQQTSRVSNQIFSPGKIQQPLSSGYLTEYDRR
eukprot:scpid93188/ scgid5982/ 